MKRSLFFACFIAVAVNGCRDTSDATVANRDPALAAPTSTISPTEDPMATNAKKNESSQQLSGKTIAFIATDGVEQSELLKPREIFDAQGAKTVLISLKPGTIQGMKHADKGDSIPVDIVIEKAKPEEFDALVLPGGLANPDALRQNLEVVSFVRSFVAANKPIAAICHGPWTLIEAGGVKGHTMTSWPSLKTDLTNAGATWVDQEVVVSGNLVTSRKPDDIPAFAQTASALIAGKNNGIHAIQESSAPGRDDRAQSQAKN